MEKYVCEACIDQPDIQEHIRQEAVATNCDYCPRTSAAPIEEVANFILEGLNSEYMDEGEDWVPRQKPEGYTTDELLTNEEVGLENELLKNDILKLLPRHLWVENHPSKLPEWFARDLKWQSFCDLVKHKRRFTLLKSDPINYPDIFTDRPSEIFFHISEYFVGLDLIKTLDRGEKVFRARPNQRDGAGYRIASQLGTPPENKAIYSNRMSPAGIPMFYGSSNIQTALREISEQTKGGQGATIGEWELLTELTVLDLSNLQPAPTIFNQDKRSLRHPLLFMNAFKREICRRVKKDKTERIEYVPTQVLAEYIKHFLDYEGRKGLDGILYPRNRSKNGVNYCLFVLNEECVGRKPYRKKKRGILCSQPKLRLLKTMRM